MLRIVHVSDFHLGVRFKQLIGSDVPSFVNSNILKNVSYSIRYAIDVDADLYLVTGDVFNKLYQSLEYSHTLVENFRELLDAGVKVFIVAGNHDVPRVKYLHNALYIVNKLGVEGIRFFEIPPKKPLIIDVNGFRLGLVILPYVHVLDHPREKISRYVKDMMEGIGNVDYKVLAAHLDVFGAKYSEPDSLIRSFYMLPYRVNPDVLYPDYFDYVALGHIHLGQSIQGYPNMWYSGSIDRVNFGETSQRKGFLHVDLDDSPRVNFIETEPIKMFVLRGLVYKRVFSLKDFISDFEGLDSIGNSLIKIEAVFDRDAWERYRSLVGRIREYLLDMRGVKGFVVIPKFLHVSPAADIERFVELEHGWVIERLKEYINSLMGFSQKERELMLDRAMRIIKESFGG